jgi:hypothetical protein
MNIFIAQSHYHNEEFNTISVHRNEDTAFAACVKAAKDCGYISSNDNPVNFFELNDLVSSRNLEYSCEEKELKD